MLCKSLRWRLSHQVAGFKRADLNHKTKTLSLFQNQGLFFRAVYFVMLWKGWLHLENKPVVVKLQVNMCASYGLTVGCISLSQMYRNPVPWSRLILNQVLAVKVHTAQLSQKLTSKVWGLSTNVAVMDVMGVVIALAVPCQLFRPALSGKRQVQV